MFSKRLSHNARVVLVFAICALCAVEATPTLASVCTLADHIKSANSNTAVGFCPAGTSHDVITIAGDITVRVPLPPITGTITVEGGGHTISGDKRFRIFDVSGGRLIINNLTMTKGYSDDGGGAIQVRDGGRVTVNDSAFIENVSRLSGGAIDVTGEKGFEDRSKGVQGSTFSQGSELTVNKSSFIQNRSGRNGGALNLYGTSTVSNSSFIKNVAGSGGGAIGLNGARNRITNSTFSGNSARWGGAVSGGARDVTLTHLTMVDNLSSLQDSGDAISLENNSGNVRLRNSIITGRGNVHCTGRLGENIGNLIEDGSCAAPKSGDALLTDLTGSPAYYPLLDQSPAVDSADERFCPESDQIGTPRPQGGGCDIGAIESTTASAAPIKVPDVCPLPDQIIAANTDTAVGNCPAGNGADTILLIRDITLSAVLPPITSEITIHGNGHTISGGGKFRIFDVDGGALTIDKVTLTEGNATAGGAMRLQNGARVNASNVTFSRNEAYEGGAIATESSNVRLDVSDSSFFGNIVDSNGGAIVTDGGTVNITSSAFVGNRAGDVHFGGAIETRKGSVAVSNSTFSYNQAGVGGAIFSHGAETSLTHLTLVNNHASSIIGAGIYHHSGVLKLRNSIVAGSGRGDDCYGRLDENRGNLSQDGSCSAQVTGDPLLAEMTGTVAHYPLLDASPAHGAADAEYCLATDQLGKARTNCDIGAIESERDPNFRSEPEASLPVACGFRDQIIAANTDEPAGACPAGKGADIITLGQDITLSEALPTINSDLTIVGNGHTIDGDNRFRIFDIEGGEVNIKNMTLINGSRPGENGGAILVRGNADVVVANVTFRNNRAGWGGGVASIEDARLNVTHSSFFDNAAEEKGGAILFGSRECWELANPILGENRSGTEIPGPNYEIFGAHVELGRGARQCTHDGVARQVTWVWAQP